MAVDFDDVFAALRSVLDPYAAKPAFIVSDRPNKYVLSSATKSDRAGKPLFIACAQVNKNSVSYRLMPIYMNPVLQAAVSPALKKRMQGKACFNFTSIEPSQVRELADLTKRGVAYFKNVKLSWEHAKPRPVTRRKG